MRQFVVQLDPRSASVWKARTLKAECEVVSYAGAPHGFAEGWMGLEDASLGPKTEEWQWDTMRRTDTFLEKLGWLVPRR